MELQMNPAPDAPVIVIGAGIVGLCVAFELSRAGYRVEVIDPADPGSECSSGNAGAISAGSVAPLAMPGAIRSAVSMLLDTDSPLHVPFRYWLPAAPWFARFFASATPVRVEQVATALQDLFTGAVEHHQALAQEIGCPQRVVKTGQLHLYRDQVALAKDNASWQLRRTHGVQAEVLDANGIRELEPAVSQRYHAAVFMPEQAAVTEPFRYASAIAEALRERGASFIRDRVLRLARGEDGWQVQGEVGHYDAQRVVLAAGAWSAGLLRPLGVRVPLESQRGYHMHIAQPGVSISRPVVLTDRKVFMAPMETGLRVAGTVEFGGLSMPPTRRRATVLGDYAKEGLPDLQLDPQASLWMGHRPCLPDSLPVLGPVPRHDGLWCAFGHGHLGLTGSVNTGRWIAKALRGEFDLKRFRPFSVMRF
jgi:glycine/D-amino acid oxidase-like deaminating enzyme